MVDEAVLMVEIAAHGDTGGDNRASRNIAFDRGDLFCGTLRNGIIWRGHPIFRYGNAVFVVLALQDLLYLIQGRLRTQLRLDALRGIAMIPSGRIPGARDDQNQRRYEKGQGVTKVLDLSEHALAYTKGCF